MNSQKLIKRCLIDNDALETHPWENEYKDFIVMRHKSNNKWFALIFETENELCINLKCYPDLIPVLKDQYPAVKPAWHMNKKHWISVHFDKDVPDRTIEDLVKQSYDLVAASLPKKERAALQTP